MGSIQEFGHNIQRLIQGEDLNFEETYGMFKEVLEDRQPDLHQGAFLAALVSKGETVDEIAGAWKAIDEIDTVHTQGSLPDDLFENSGTGMDRLKTFNVSSASAIVAAACGVPMARHGARALTSKCGTVDMLEAMGIDVECEVSLVEKSILEAGIGLFNGMSPMVHPGALGRILSQIRFGSTLNIAASLANPARPRQGLRGVYSDKLVERAGSVMRRIGYRRGMVVYGTDKASGMGMDEISPCGETFIHEFNDETSKEYAFVPEDAGVKAGSFDEVAFTGTMKSEAERFASVLSGKGHAGCVDFTCLNTAAILYTAGKAKSMKEGVDISRETIRSGKAVEKMRQWIIAQNINGSDGLKRFEAML